MRATRQVSFWLAAVSILITAAGASAQITLPIAEEQVVYELIGERRKAIQCLMDLRPGTNLSEVQNDPGMQRLWADPEFKRKLQNRPVR